MGEYLLSLSQDHTGTATHTYHVKLASNISLRAVTIRCVCDRPSVHLSVSTATWTKKNLKIRISKILLRTRRLVIISCRHYNKSEIKKYTTNKKNILAADTNVAVHKLPLYSCNWGEYCAVGQPAEYRPTSAVQVLVYSRKTRCKYHGVKWEIITTNLIVAPCIFVESLQFINQLMHI